MIGPPLRLVIRLQSDLLKKPLERSMRLAVAQDCTGEGMSKKIVQTDEEK